MARVHAYACELNQNSKPKPQYHSAVAIPPHELHGSPLQIPYVGEEEEEEGKEKKEEEEEVETPENCILYPPAACIDLSAALARSSAVVCHLCTHTLAESLERRTCRRLTKQSWKPSFHDRKDS
jgi:hypothetical protein